MSNRIPPQQLGDFVSPLFGGGGGQAQPSLAQQQLDKIRVQSARSALAAQENRQGDEDRQREANLANTGLIGQRHRAALRGDELENRKRSWELSKAVQGLHHAEADHEKGLERMDAEIAKLGFGSDLLEAQIKTEGQRFDLLGEELRQAQLQTGVDLATQSARIQEIQEKRDAQMLVVDDLRSQLVEQNAKSLKAITEASVAAATKDLRIRKMQLEVEEKEAARAKDPQAWTNAMRERARTDADTSAITEAANIMADAGVAAGEDGANAPPPHQFFSALVAAADADPTLSFAPGKAGEEQKKKLVDEGVDGGRLMGAAAEALTALDSYVQQHGEFTSARGNVLKFVRDWTAWFSGGLVGPLEIPRDYESDAQLKAMVNLTNRLALLFQIELRRPITGAQAPYKELRLLQEVLLDFERGSSATLFTQLTALMTRGSSLQTAGVLAEHYGYNAANIAGKPSLYREAKLYEGERSMKLLQSIAPKGGTFSEFRPLALFMERNWGIGLGVSPGRMWPRFGIKNKPQWVQDADDRLEQELQDREVIGQ